jgi:hypothetical protein
VHADGDPERPAKRLVGRVAHQMTASTARFAKTIGKRHPCRSWVCLNFGLRNPSPFLPFKFVPMKGGNTQTAVVRRRLGERAKSDPLLPFLVGPGAEGMRHRT